MCFGYFRMKTKREEDIWKESVLLTVVLVLLTIRDKDSTMEKDSTSKVKRR